MTKRGTGLVAVSTTVDGAAKARRLARRIVDARLAACVQIAAIRSVYRWKGKVESASEFLLLAKTRLALAPALAAFIKQNHSYELPEITVMPVTGGFAPYLEWISSETKQTRTALKTRG